MKSIIQNKEETLVVNKSKFICSLYKIQNKEEIDKYLNITKAKYKGATHYCYAYILENLKKCSDDKEPSGTAGLPILNVLEHQDLNYILCVVVRYFGGIKLGTGGLVRAYTDATIKALKNNTKEIEKGLKIELIFKYDYTKMIDNLFKDHIINKEFNENIKYTVLISYDEYNKIKDKLNDININIINENIII